ncbi:hypothetical protein QAD02_007248 [Eretmocerus hayati]|uniref:Uncharacterized protein n=1 Tax=Eretmocerus hayati TaxID=131215 RepID=A0ACC2N3G8_9HYME|nr:hypothetical protein QAD02_007248 [Eretmocerus hayati]
MGSRAQKRKSTPLSNQQGAQTKKKPGKTPARTPEQILAASLGREVLSSDGGVKPRANKVWTDARDLDSSVTAINLYFKVYQNRHSLYVDYCDAKGIDPAPHLNKIGLISRCETSEQEFLSEPETDNSDDEVDESEVKKVGRPWLFEIVLEKDVWNKISPMKEADGKEAIKQILREGWRDIIVDSLYEQKGVCCPYVFSHHNFSSAGPYSTIQGMCSDKDCLAPIELVCPVEPTCEGGALFNVETIYVGKFFHKKSRPLAGQARENAKAQLLHETAAKFQKELAGSAVANPGQPLPPTISPLPVLRNARREGIFENLKLDAKKSMWENLNGMLYFTEYGPFFITRLIGYNRFYAVYQSPGQIETARYVIIALKLGVKIDTSGGMISKINHEPGDERDCLLTIMIAVYDGKTYPLSQFASECNTIPHLELWLKGGYLGQGGPIPPCAVSDMSKALQGAIASVFNGMTYKQYLNSCMEYLVYGTTIKLRFQLRIDISHLIGAVVDWACFDPKKNGASQKNFYCACVGVISNCTDLATLSTILKYIFIVGSSQEVNAIRSIPASNRTVNDFFKKLKGEARQELEAGNQRQTSKQQSSSIRVSIANAFVNEDFVNRLLGLCNEMVCWTGLMNGYFGNTIIRAISSDLEIYFKHIKEELLENGQRLRCDRWIAVHSSDITNSLKRDRPALEDAARQKELAAKANARIQAAQKLGDDLEHLREEEHWKAKNLSTDPSDHLSGGISEESAVQ